MNERFFDLKKDRQDRIINGAMRIFAQNGYRHASTDEMVAAASISKGLLFHYFKSKKGTWEFLYEYSTRYTLLELREAQRRRGCDLFEMYRQLVRVDAAILQKYRHMPLFLRRADEELGTDDPKFEPEIPESLAGAVADLETESGHRSAETALPVRTGRAQDLADPGIYALWPDTGTPGAGGSRRQQETFC